jgi:hypothetical protein
MGLKLNGTHQVLVMCWWLNLLGNNVGTISEKRNITWH